MRNRAILMMAAVVLFVVVALLSPIKATAAPSVTFVSDNSSSAVPRYEKYEATFQIGGVGTAFTDFNPFNPNLTALGSQYYNKKGILVDAVITTPSGGTQQWPLFWYEGSDGSRSWKLRYAPTATGTWKYYVRVKYGSDTVNSGTRTFTCSSSSDHGFIRVNSNDTRFFSYTDGTSYYPIGTDISGYSMGGGAAATAFPKMKANGGNYTRVFFTSLNIEPYDTQKNASVKSLNNYNMSRARSIDDMWNVAHTNGIRIVWCLDDWTYIKDAANQYISLSGREAPATDVAGFFTLSSAKDIYKRKLRYWLARWGYSTNFLGFDFINETGGSTACYNWHIEMANYVDTYSEQPHLSSGDNGSGELRNATIPYDNAAMDFAQYHDYAKYSQAWTIKANSPNLEKMGCTLQYPWVDMSVYVDRLARLQYKRYKWMKPLSWNEFGLIYKYPGSSGFPDWNDAYNADTTARHYRDAIWAGMFCGVSVAHWKLDYMVGGTKYAGGDKFWIFKPLANFMNNEELIGMTQETTYPVADDTNPSPKVTCSNSQIMVIAMRNNTRAYFFAKNLTDVWAKCIPSYGYPGGTCAALPSSSAQSGTVTVGGLDAGTYIFERWSTTDTNAGTQVKASTSVTVGTDGKATLPVSIGASDVGFAYKLKKSTTSPPPPTTGTPTVALTLAASLTNPKPGQTVTYTVTYKNTGSGTANAVVIESVVPANCTYVSGSGGTYNATSRKVTWTLPSLAAGATGTVQYKVTVD